MAKAQTAGATTTEPTVRVTVDLPVSLARRLERHGIERHGGEPGARLYELAQLFADVPAAPSDRVTVIGPELRERLEQLLGMGHILNGEDLLQKVQGLASLKIGGVSVDFSPKQWEELTTRAEKQGRTVEETVADVVKRMSGDFFNYA